MNVKCSMKKITPKELRMSLTISLLWHSSMSFRSTEICVLNYVNCISFPKCVNHREMLWKFKSFTTVSTVPLWTISGFFQRACLTHTIWGVCVRRTILDITVYDESCGVRVLSEFCQVDHVISLRNWSHTGINVSFTGLFIRTRYLWKASHVMFLFYHFLMFVEFVPSCHN